MPKGLYVQIIGDSRSYERALQRSGVATQQFTAGVGSSLGKGVLAFGAVAAASAVAGRAVRASFDEFVAMQKVVAQTNAVLRSTGAIAGVTAQHVQSLAHEILRYSGIDDEAVAAGENLLLTFKNIRNQAGAGNAIFDRATKAAADLSIAWDTDLSSAAIRLGKAINDPVRGLTALQRTGIQFTQAQRDQIKALVEAGHVLAAQKIELAEIESQIGGSARAYGQTLPGQVDIAQESLKNFGGNLVTKLAPAMVDTITALQQMATAVRKLGDAFGHLPGENRLLKFLNDTLDKAPAWFKVFGPLGPVASLFGGSTTATASLQGPQGRGLPPAPGPVGPQSGRGGTQRAFALSQAIRIAQARAAVTASVQDDVAVARRIRASIQKQIKSGLLSGDRLIAALGELATAEATIRGALADETSKRKDDADREATARKKHADAIKCAAEKQQAAAQEAAQQIAQATDQARSEIGALFQGPVLSPTDAARKLALGVPGPDPVKILADIRAQTAQALRFEGDLRKLGRLGVGKPALTELRGLGTEGLPKIEAILGAPQGVRGQLVRALIGRERAAQKIGQMIVHTPHVTLHAREVRVAGGGGNSRSGRFAGQ